MNTPTVSFLQSRIRLATVRGPESRDPASPIRRHSTYASGPFIEASVPHWGSLALERNDMPRRGSALVSSMPDSGMHYVLHVMQIGPMQVRTLMPTSFGGARRLLKHAAEHEQLCIAFNIEETTQVLEVVTGLDRNIASRALAAPQVPMSKVVVRDEANLVVALACADGAPSLIEGHPVLDILVVYCGDATEFLLKSHGHSDGVAGQNSASLH